MSQPIDKGMWERTNLPAPNDDPAREQRDDWNEQHDATLETDLIEHMPKGHKLCTGCMGSGTREFNRGRCGDPQDDDVEACGVCGGYGTVPRDQEHGGPDA